MARPTITPTGVERTFAKEEIIVSKTDPSGVITYANDVFCRLAGYTEDELLGQQHNIVRHPEMPRCVFKLLWDTISTGQEIFAFVVNLSRNGDHYWVFAHVTPTFDEEGQIVSYHSSRRLPSESATQTITGVYKMLLEEEERHASPKDAVEAATQLLLKVLGEKGVTYEEFLFGLLEA
ncbi:PAS domain-containing protein [Magnetovibrio sp. PR-2]|uniref:PAS domain-containing protein n=1 Tax=Magnetovibrio sp. PR-2 TaxID=3120356 RepID=UPI002FCE318E